MRRYVIAMLALVVIVLAIWGGYTMWYNSHVAEPSDFPGLKVEVWGDEFWFQNRIDDEETAKRLDKSILAMDVHMANYLRQRKYKAENQFQKRGEFTGNTEVRFIFRNAGQQEVKFHLSGAPAVELWEKNEQSTIVLQPGESREIVFTGKGMWYAWLSPVK